MLIQVDHLKRNTVYIGSCGGGGGLVEKDLATHSSILA